MILTNRTAWPNYLWLPLVLLLHGCPTAPIDPEEEVLGGEEQVIVPPETGAAEVTPYGQESLTDRYTTSVPVDEQGLRPIGLNNPSLDAATAAEIAQLSRLIYFAFDSAEVPAQAQPLIERHAALLRANPGLRIALEGHADERGTREYNIGLGERRGLAVQRLLSLYGVAPTQMEVVSYGEERPLAFGVDEESFARNRRVEIVY